METLIEFGYKLAVFFIPFLFAICFHEYAHAWMAKRRGDNTAEMMGRLTMNPMAHASPLGTFVLPILSLGLNAPIFFGWANPVPVNSTRLNNPRVDMFWVALAGPLANILLAVLATLALATAFRFGSGDRDLVLSIKDIVQKFISINLFLAIFNMLPIPPLDGSKVLARFLSRETNAKIEEYEPYFSYLLLFLVLSGLLKFLATPVFAMERILMTLAFYGGFA